MENWVQDENDALRPVTIITGNFQKNYRKHFGILQNYTVYEWSETTFHCINQVNSERAFAVG